jgi:alkanesulfonate monooxygenase SsuD/methylene tetrahydromethanopterin reductase-like flavin-dependent oxidoreductase (luciferase family)
MPELIFGVDVPTAVGDDPVAAARDAERLGFDFVSASDHPAGTLPTHDTLTMLTWIAAHTSRVRVATRVLGVPFRRPAMVAKTAASLDQLTGGRLILGLGAGHSDQEIRAVGGPVPSGIDKIHDLADAVRIIRGAWTTRNFTHHGHRLGAYDLEMEPKPHRPIPIWLGTFGPRALVITGELADGWIPSHSHAPPDRIPAMRRRIDAAAESAGRDPATIRSVYNVAVRIDPDASPGPELVAGTPDRVLDQLRRFIDLGFTGINIMTTDPNRTDQLQRIAGDVLPALRDAAARR